MAVVHITMVIGEYGCKADIRLKDGCDNSNVV